MVLPPLDLPTLFVVTAATTMFSGVVLVLAGGRDRPSIPLWYWGGAMIAGAVGIILLSLAPIIGVVAYLAGDFIILFATALSWTGARIFGGRPCRKLALFAGPASWLICALFPFLIGIFSTALAMLIGSSFTFASATELWTGRSEPLRARNPAILLLLLHAFLYLGRAAYTLHPWELGWFPVGEFAVILLFEALFHTIGMAFLLLILMKERAELQSTVELRQLALLDGLTGLGNRRHFDQVLDHEYRRAIRSDKSLALLLIDADAFKSYNDIYGHQAGDECLRAIASAIQSALRRASDAGMRYGGEEFATLLIETSETEAILVAGTIHASLAAMKIKHEGTSGGKMTVSIGVAVMKPTERPDHSAADLVRHADRALYAAKSGGRNQTCLARPSVGQCLQPEIGQAFTAETSVVARPTK